MAWNDYTTKAISILMDANISYGTKVREQDVPLSLIGMKSASRTCNATGSTI
jgi:hypothetical protein